MSASKEKIHEWICQTVELVVRHPSSVSFENTDHNLMVFLHPEDAEYFKDTPLVRNGISVLANAMMRARREKKLNIIFHSTAELVSKSCSPSS